LTVLTPSTEARSINASGLPVGTSTEVLVAVEACERPVEIAMYSDATEIIGNAILNVRLREFIYYLP
jgi:hypothetical protein